MTHNRREQRVVAPSAGETPHSRKMASEEMGEIVEIFNSECFVDNM